MDTFNVTESTWHNGTRQIDQVHPVADESAAIALQGSLVANRAAAMTTLVRVTRQGREFGIHHTDAYGGQWVTYYAVAERTS